MNTRKKVFFVCPRLSLGGAERLMLDILASLDRRRYVLHLVYAKKDDSCSSFVPGDVTCHNMEKHSKLDFFRIVRNLSRLYKKEKPDVVVGFLEYANYLAILAGIVSSVKPVLVITIHNFLSLHLLYTEKMPLHRFLIRTLYPRAQRIVAVSRGVRDDLVSSFHCPPDKLKVIYNSVNIDTVRRFSREPVADGRFTAAGNVRKIITCGRLTYQKNQGLLLEAFARVMQRIKAHLFLLGAGEDAKALERQAARLGLSECVTFCGFVANPYKYMAASDLFVLSSRYEGFGNVLIEAMACSTAVVSTACPAGPDEIITHGKNGWLVPPGDADALAGAILRLSENDALRGRIARQGEIRARDFDTARITAQYAAVLDELLG